MFLKQECLNIWKSFRAKFISYSIGLDIGSEGIKLVVLKKESSQLSLYLAVSAPLPKEAVLGHRIVDIAAVAKVLKSLIDSHTLPSNKVAIALPSSEVISQLISLKISFLEEDEATLEQLLLLEMERYLPYPLAEMTIDYQILGPHRSEADKINILVVAAKKDALSTYLKVLDYAGLVASSIDVEQYALARTYPWLENTIKNIPSCFGLVYFGTYFVTITVINGTESIYCQEQRLNMESEISVKFIAHWIERALSLFYASGIRHEIDGILLMGDNYPKDKNLIKFLNEHLALNVAWANPSMGMQTCDHMEDLNPIYVLSMGLALRGLT